MEISAEGHKPNLEFLLVFFLILLSAFFFYHFAMSIKLLSWDEPVYLGNAKSHLGVSYFTEDFRFPLLEYGVALVWLIFWESVLFAKFFIIVFSLFSILGFYLISKLLFDKSYLRFLLPLSLALNPVFLKWGFRIYNDVPAMCAIIFSIYFLLRYEKDFGERTFNLLMVGFFLGIAFLFKFPAIMYSVLILIYVLFRTRLSYLNSLKDLIFVFIGGILTISPWIIYNFFKYGNPFWDLFEQTRVISQYTSYQNPMILVHFLITTFGILLIFLFPFFYSLLQSLFFRIRKGNFKDLDFFNFFICFSLLFEITIYLFVINLKLERYILMFLPFLLIGIVSGISSFLDFLKMLKLNFSFNLFFKKRKRRIRNKIKSKIKTRFRFFHNFKDLNFLSLMLFLFVLFILFFYSLSAKSYLDSKIKEDSDGAFLKSIKFSELNIPEGDTIISNSWTNYGYFGNHRVTSYYEDNISNIIEKTNAEWIIYVKKGGLIIDETLLFKQYSDNLQMIFNDSFGQEVYVFKI